MNTRIGVVTLALVGVGLLTASAQSQVSAGKYFERGRTRLSLTGGWGQAFNQDYFILGAGAGYYLFNGFEIGVDGESWLGNSPKINKVSPEARYIFQGVGTVFPYLGGFYRRTFYEDVEDADSVGGRAGVFAPIGGPAYMGIGGVYERQLDCDTAVYDHCSALYPEFSIIFAF